MKRVKRYAVFASSAICTVLVSACISDSGSSGLSYTGSTAPAAITSSNGEDIIRAAYTNGEGGGSVGSVFASVTAPQGGTKSGSPRLVTAVHLLLGALDSIDPATSKPSLSRAISSDSLTTAGDCGGSANNNVSVNNVTYDVTGTITFDNYCNANETMNGVISISGKIDPDTRLISNATIALSSVSITARGDSFTADGAIFVAPGEISTSPDEVTVNIKIRDNTTGQVFRTENMVIGIVQEVSSELLNIRGKFYHPDYGYVYLTTQTPLSISNTDLWPSAGTLIATGASSSKVKLTATSSTTYSIEIDADGDAAYDGNDVLYETQLSGYWETTP